MKWPNIAARGHSGDQIGNSAMVVVVAAWAGRAGRRGLGLEPTAESPDREAGGMLPETECSSSMRQWLPGL